MATRLRLLSTALSAALLLPRADGASRICRQFQLHVRSHFFTNVGVAGGLLLLQTFGAGKYSVDGILKKKAS